MSTLNASLCLSSITPSNFQNSFTSRHLEFVSLHPQNAIFSAAENIRCHEQAFVWNMRLLLKWILICGLLGCELAFNKPLSSYYRRRLCFHISLYYHVIILKIRNFHKYLVKLLQNWCLEYFYRDQINKILSNE